MRGRRRTLQDLTAELQTRLARLRDEIGADCGDRPVTPDEAGYFRLIDQAANDREAHPILDDIGHRFADCFLLPYLHASDLAGVLDEIAGLFAIHHRARMVIERVDDDSATITILTSGARHGDGSPTPFDIAVLDTALLSRFRDVTITRVLLSNSTPGSARHAFEVRVRHT